MKELIVGNWKMFTTTAEAELLVERVDAKVLPTHGSEVVFCPPATALENVKAKLNTLKHKQSYSLGIQNIYDQDEGPFTGEISAAQVKDLVNYAIVGHSERRRIFAERDTEIAKKVAACLRHNITPILCVGETLAEREAGHSKRVVVDQLTVDLGYMTAQELENIVIAYEPVWAIGTGNFAKPDDVREMIGVIRGHIEELYGEIHGAHVRVLYGGSVEPENARSYTRIAGCDGLLVGGASINYIKFSEIINLSHR